MPPPVDKPLARNNGRNPQPTTNRIFIPVGDKAWAFPGQLKGVACSVPITILAAKQMVLWALGKQNSLSLSTLVSYELYWLA